MIYMRRRSRDVWCLMSDVYIPLGPRSVEVGAMGMMRHDYSEDV
jgi:hypothetical protein